jgi:hypothetical protein
MADPLHFFFDKHLFSFILNIEHVSLPTRFVSFVINYGSRTLRNRSVVVLHVAVYLPFIGEGCLGGGWSTR